MERTIIYRTQRTVTDVRTKGGMKAHIFLCGEIARVKGKRFWIFKLPDRYVRRTWLMEYVKTVRGTYVPIKCYLKRLSFESVKRVMKVENIIEVELKAKCNEYKKKSGKAE
mgnify:CR=1 FL=1